MLLFFIFCRVAIEGIIGMSNAYNLLRLETLQQISDEINKELDVIFENYAFKSLLVEMLPIRERVIDYVFGDIQSLTKEDPSVRNLFNVAWTSNSFKAIRYYRYANAIYNCVNTIEEDHKLQIVRDISEEAKRDTNVEIHPLATIGERFVMDHGTNTIIGERCIIGDDCFILNDVVLGTALDKKKPDPVDKRHPTLGDRVKVYGGAKILGGITVGNDSIVGTRCIVKRNIPSGSRIFLVNQLQLSKINGNTKILVYGVVPRKPNCLCILGENFRTLFNIKMKILSKKYKVINRIKLSLQTHTDTEIEIMVNDVTKLDESQCIQISAEDQDVILTDCVALKVLKGE